MNLPLPDDATVTLTVGQLRALVEGRRPQTARGGTEEIPAVDNTGNLLVELWKREATRNLCRDASWADARSSGDTPKDEKGSIA
jgi:hypothetical protein